MLEEAAAVDFGDRHGARAIVRLAEPVPVLAHRRAVAVPVGIWVCPDAPRRREFDKRDEVIRLCDVAVEGLLVEVESFAKVDGAGARAAAEPLVVGGSKGRMRHL